MWIGQAGSEGYGLSKERQGYDQKASNYDKSMDARNGLGRKGLAFLGVPGSIKFDGAAMIEQKKLQKATESYFALDTKSMDFNEASAARQAVFDKYGITADQFYKGILSKYDSASTKRIKGLKEEARIANKSLFDEYAAQPEGTRNIWATNKLKELNDKNYFAGNPFKKSFKYINRTSIDKADKQVLVQEAVRTGNWKKYQDKYGLTQKQKDYQYATSSGDWSKWRSKYGTKSAKAADYTKAQSTGDWSEWESKYGRTEKALARDKALKTGDWSGYANTYGVSKTTTPYQHDGKYFKSAESLAKYKEGKFWEQYANASKTERQQLLAANPQFNHRANWTADQWTKQKVEDKAKLVKKARSWGDFAKNQDANKAKAQVAANKFLSSRGSSIKMARR
jgi:hypothetical protein